MVCWSYSLFLVDKRASEGGLSVTWRRTSESFGADVLFALPRLALRSQPNLWRTPGARRKV